MQPMAVDMRLLRTVLTPDIKIMPGRAMMARVANADGSGRGSLSIAGIIVEAELPKDVQAGQDLRLVVRDVNAERVLLSVAPEHQAQQAQQPLPQAPPPLPPPVPLPGGGSVQVTEREARGGSGESAASQVLSLRYQAPVAGAVDLRFVMDPGTLQLGVSVSPATLAMAQESAESLRQALSEQLGRAVTVTVTPRREPVDLYA